MIDCLLLVVTTIHNDAVAATFRNAIAFFFPFFAITRQTELFIVVCLSYIKFYFRGSFFFIM